MPDPAVKTSPPVHFKSLKGPWHLKKPSNLKNLKQHKKLKNKQTKSNGKMGDI